jgi:polysaccharide biosynthesis transport protein
MNINVRRESQPDEPNPHESRLEKRSQSDDLTAAVASNDNSEEGGLDLGRIVDTLKRRLWTVLIVNAIVMGATVVWSRTRPPAYEGSFKILIEPVTAEGQVVSALKGNQTSVEEQDLGSAQALKTTLDYPTQIQILLSQKLLGPVIQQIKHTYPKTSYEILKKSLNINRLKDAADTKILEVRYRGGSANETTDVLNFISRAYVQYSLSERQTNVRRAIQFVDSQLPKIQTEVRNLESVLQNFREQHQLVDPTTLGTQLGTRMSNTQQEQLTAQVELAKTKQLYRSLEQQLQMQPKGAEAASVLSEAPGYQQLLKQLQNLDVELKIQSAQLTDEHPTIILLREKRQQLVPLLQEQANAVLGSKLAQSNPNVQLLPYQNALRQDLSKQFIAAATQVQVLEVKLNRLNEASQALAVQTGQLPIVSRQYENLQRQLKIATEQLSKFSQKREELMINAARQEVPWELIAAPAIEKLPSASLSKDLVLGSIVGLMLGTGVALLLETMNNVIYSIKDLRKELKIAILGMIPNREDEQKILNKIKHKKGTEDSSFLTETSGIIPNNRYRFSPFIESFRALNSQIRLLNPDSPIRSLVVSSSLPDEGKTTVAIQLAQAAAAMGQRVLLVNADLRKPSLQTLVSQDDSDDLIYGLTDVIVGSSTLMDTVQLLPGEENLYILLAGSISLDPTSLLSSQKMRDLMKICQHNFDLVIYDTVPLNFADSLLLIPQTDGLLMVSRLGRVNREVLRNSLRTLNVSKVSVLGLVVNMVNDSQSSAEVYYAQQVVPV